MKGLRWVVLCAALLFAGEARAFEISSGFTRGCHEEITIAAFVNFLGDYPLDQIPIPKGEVWRELSTALEEQYGVSFNSEGERVLFLSLLIGVRAPDSDGHSLLNLSKLRESHSNPEGQYIHALRGIDDDGPEGDQVAVAEIRARILDRVQTSATIGMREAEAQLIEVPLFVDFYGQVFVEVWGPAFHVGEALHTLQDGFSHTIRTDDLRRIRHVMNYADAIAPDHNERRDGMAHSGRMDLCEGEVNAIKLAATEASLSFLLALRNANDPDLPEGRLTLEDVLDEWFTYEVGCDIDNAYCGSYWVGVARESQTGPYLEEACGCDLRARGGRARGGALLWLAALGLWAWRRS